MNVNAPVNLNAINPPLTEYHNVKILIITLRLNAIEISTPPRVNKPMRVPSVIPIPQGIKDIAPARIDVA